MAPLPPAAQGRRRHSALGSRLDPPLWASVSSSEHRGVYTGELQRSFPALYDLLRFGKLSGLQAPSPQLNLAGAKVWGGCGQPSTLGRGWQTGA